MFTLEPENYCTKRCHQILSFIALWEPSLSGHSDPWHTESSNPTEVRWANWWKPSIYFNVNMTQKTRFIINHMNKSNNNNNNNNNRVYPNPHSGQRVLALIGWFKRAVILCGGTKAQKQQSHHSNSGCWTGVLVTLIGRLCGTDPTASWKNMW